MKIYKKILVVTFLEFLILMLPLTSAVSQRELSVSNIVKKVGPSPVDDLVVTIATDKIFYWKSEPVLFTISITNTGQEDVTIWFPNNHLADYCIFDNDYCGVYYWPTGKEVWLDIVITIIIPLGETVELFSNQWNQVDYEGNQVPPGKYCIGGQTAEFYCNDIKYPQKSAGLVYFRISRFKNNVFMLNQIIGVNPLTVCCLRSQSQSSPQQLTLLHASD